MASTTDTNGGLREELRGDAQTLGKSAAQRLEGEIDARKGGAAEQVQSLSSAIGTAANELGDQSPQWLRSALEQGARTLDGLARSVQQKDAHALSGDVQRLARENPGTFLAGCALAGFAAARVFKAGSAGGSNQSDTGYPAADYATGLAQPSFATQTAPAPEAVS